MKTIIIDIAKIITAVCAIGGAALWFDSKFDKQDDDLKDIKQTVEYINYEQSLMAEDIQGIHDTLADIENGVNKNTDRIESLNWAVRNIDNFTPEQLQEILNREFQRERIYNRESDIVFIPVE